MMPDQVILPLIVSKLYPDHDPITPLPNVNRLLEYLTDEGCVLPTIKTGMSTRL
jgi:hypothetical protein